MVKMAVGGTCYRWVPPSFQFRNFFLFVDKLYTYWRCAYFMDIKPPENEVAGVYSDPYVHLFVRSFVPPNL